MMIDPATAAGASEYKGATYYFCAGGCKVDFDKDPEKYLDPTGDGVNRIDDVLAVRDAYFMDDTDGNPGLPPYAVGYNPDTDRTLLGPDPWDTGPPKGLQRVDETPGVFSGAPSGTMFEPI